MSAAPPERALTAGRLPQIISIQYLRAVAALAVVAFHALEPARHRFGVGAAGVDVFFLISGFIMWTLTENAEASPGQFIWRRVIRVAPPYWIATLLAAVVATVRPHFLWAPPFSLADLGRSLAFAPYADAWGRPYPVLTQGWTLNYEMFFYALFTVGLFAPRRRQLLLLSLALGGLMAAGFLLPGANPAVRTYTSLDLAEFLAGVWLGRVWLTGRMRSAAVGWALVTLALAAFTVEQAMGVREGPWRAIYWGLPALGLVSGALCLEGAGLVRCWRLPKALGDGSYSVYLFHVFVVALCMRLLGWAPTALRVSVTLAASAAAGWVLFRVLERPLTTVLRGAPKLLKPAPTGLQGAGAP
jgi:exopolysaccharide production protein ExoZ